MKFALTVGALALGTALTMAPAANALGVIWSETYEYGNQAGQRDPGGTDPLSDGYVTVKDNSTGRFNDFFDFSGLSYASIDNFKLTLTFGGAGPSFFPSEYWSARVQGSNSGLRATISSN